MALNGKVAIVTGGATGLGAAVCLGLAARGASVAVLYRSSATSADETVEACRSLGAKAIAVQGDVGSDEGCRKAAAIAIGEWGRIDLLVNSAGRTKTVPQANLEGLSGQDFLDIYRTNVVGAFQMVRACAPHMQQAGFGAIVNVSSLAGLTGMGTSMAYAASKGALNTLTKSLARTLAPTIRVNAICPGFMNTGWFSDSFDEEAFAALLADQKQQTPLQRVGSAEDVARSVLFLLDEGADHITGITMSVDAGSHLGPRAASSSNRAKSQLL